MYYELMVIAKTDGAGEVGAKVEKALKDFGAGEVKLEKMGKKTLAYPIVKQTEAEYLLFNFEAQGEAVGKIDSMLRLEREAILRYLIIKGKKKGIKGTKVTKDIQEIKDTKGTEDIKRIKGEVKGTKGAKGAKGTKSIKSVEDKKAVKTTKKGKKSS